VYSYKNIYYIHFDTIDSTNTWTKNNAHTLDQSRVTCITALEQTAGRGRFLRKWVSPRGQNIYATIFFNLPVNCSYLLNVGQVLALSCVNVLKNKGFSAQIKWPNDLMLEGKKVAGILCETIRFSDRIGVVLGIGINVNMTKELLDTIDHPAISLAQLSGHTWTLEQILDPLLRHFLDNLALLQEKGFELFQSQIDSLLAYKGQTITCSDQGRTVQGICHSIDKEGRLAVVVNYPSDKKSDVHKIQQPVIIHSGEIKNPE
jgi:BirA family biotin operon repressor/biotin-[acetyl-CoA-carboxylase] ligase